MTVFMSPAGERQMEVQAFVAITCHDILRAEAYFQVRFRYVWQDLCSSISMSSRFTPHICLFLISAGEGWNEGHAGFRAYLFTLRTSSIVPPQLPLQDFSHFCSCFCFGNRTRDWTMGASRGSPECLSGQARQEFFPTAHIACFIHLGYFYNSNLNTMTECNHFILLYRAETWLLSYMPLIPSVQTQVYRGMKSSLVR